MTLPLRNWKNRTSSVPTAHVPPRKVSAGVTAGVFDSPFSSFAFHSRLPHLASEMASRRTTMPRSWSLLSATPPSLMLHSAESDELISGETEGAGGSAGVSRSASGMGSLPRLPRRCDSATSYGSTRSTIGPTSSMSNSFTCSRFSSEEDVSTREELSFQGNRIAALENKIKQMESNLKSPVDSTAAKRSKSPRNLHLGSSEEDDSDVLRDEVKKLTHALQKSNLKIETWQMAFKKECEQSRSLDLLNRSYLDKYRRLKSKARSRLSEQGEKMDEERAQAEALRVSFDIQSEELAECQRKLKKAESELSKSSPSVRGVVSRLSFVPGLRSSNSILSVGSGGTSHSHDRGSLYPGSPISNTAKKMTELRCQISTELAKNQFLVKCLLDICESTRAGKHADLNAVLGLASGASSISESDSEDAAGSPAVIFGADPSDPFSSTEDQVYQQLRMLLSKTQRIHADLTKLHSIAQDKVADVAAASVDACNTQ